MERAINRSEQCQLVGTEYGSCGSSGQCARVAISGSETVLGDRRMLHIPFNALLTAGFRSDHHLVLPRFPSSFGKKENGIRLCLFGIKTLLVRYSMAEVGQLIGPLISCGAELYGSRLGLGLISRSKLFLSVSAFQDVREEVQRPVMESVC